MTRLEQAMKEEAFERSEFYFCGESQASRAANWLVWKAAWDASNGARKMTDLEKAAIAYRAAQEAAKSAAECHAHIDLVSALVKNREEAEDELLYQAKVFANDHFDGAES